MLGNNECQVSISNPLIYVTCYNKQLRDPSCHCWYYTTLLYNSILFVAVESQVRTLRIIAFLSREEKGRQQ